MSPLLLLDHFFVPSGKAHIAAASTSANPWLTAHWQSSIEGVCVQVRISLQLYETGSGMLTRCPIWLFSHWRLVD